MKSITSKCYNTTTMNFIIQNLLQIELFLSILTIIGLVVLYLKIVNLNRLKKDFFAGTKALDLEQVLFTLSEKISQMEDRQLQAEQGITLLEDQLQFAIQKIGVIRFNPFEDGGGNFSFSLALLNAYNTGLVLTSIHGRQQNRIYTKKILLGISESVLTEEEQKAILTAQQK